MALLRQNQKVTANGTIDYDGQIYVVHLKKCEMHAVR